MVTNNEENVTTGTTEDTVVENPITIEDLMAERALAPALPLGATVQPVGTTITQNQLMDTSWSYSCRNGCAFNNSYYRIVSYCDYGSYDGPSHSH